MSDEIEKKIRVKRAQFDGYYRFRLPMQIQKALNIVGKREDEERRKNVSAFFRSTAHRWLDNELTQEEKDELNWK